MTRRVLLSLVLVALAAHSVAQESRPARRSYIGVMIAAGKEKGTVLVMTVIGDSPAGRGGLRTGDVILKIDGAAPPDFQTAVKVIGALKPGRKARLLIVREGKQATVEVVPIARDD